MSDDFHRPTRFPSERFEAYAGGEDPAHVLRVARDTAHALVSRVRETDDDQVVERLVHYTDEHGIDAVAELWARALPVSLPGALWRIYLLRAMITQHPDEVAWLFQRGTEVIPTIDTVVAGAALPTGPAEVIELADRILRGVFRGDLAVALDRAAAFCRVESAGCTDAAAAAERSDESRAAELTTRALRLSIMADELAASARVQADGGLD
ncbi:DNA-directed RNA polymerase subunit beta [Galbitalea sp. SE-J8]|uniref:DNA-directed RNA polymerase subunit beta n=1 Tax=Galbitalea sp. SE-J8 TaxID=3054952 RepID=UPI00259CB84C|nr:DNA-directed RNA polymerase subunit beta [Galbitalea sp. SE-J8]MDM4763781.1 DNA-directed RNA polymerase subunit beta [Galbitalea sp. SE-J8]